MFRLDGNLKFLNVDQPYVRALYEHCPEVFYKPLDYENKPYIGILLSCEGRKYIIPLTSAKPKHKYLKNIDGDRFLLYEYTDESCMDHRDIWVRLDDERRVKHILSALDVKKMIPIRDDLVRIVDMNYAENDTEASRKYKDLLRKEYRFCLSIIDRVIERASKMYDDQKQTGRIAKFACDLVKLESICDTYNPNQ